MNEQLQWLLVLLAGMLLGAAFFGGLWWTVRKGATAQQPALWFGLSFLLRTGVVMVGFYLVAGDNWQRLLLCLFGFVIARIIIVRLVGMTAISGVSHAP
jgi:F1F0 ATPase subunit 2